MRQSEMKINLTYNIKLNDRDIHDEAAYKNGNQIIKDFNKSLGLKVFSGTWASITLDLDSAGAFYERITSFFKAENASFTGLCSLSYEEEINESEWYRFFEGSRPDEAYVNYRTFLECKAYKYKPNMHSDGVNGSNIIVSEKFKNVIIKNNPKGIDFLWVKDSGRYKPVQQWFMPIALHPIGRGIDHIWFDETTMKGNASHQPKDRTFRKGINRFRADQLKEDFDAPDIVKSLINLFDSKRLIIVGREKFLIDELPDSDFAYLWQESDSYRVKTDSMTGSRTLYVRGNVMDALVEAKVAGKEQFQPVMILDTPPVGTRRLSSHDEMPNPYCSPLGESFGEVKERFLRDKEKYDSLEKPVLKATLRSILKTFKSIKKESENDFRKGLSSKSIMRDKIDIPDEWLQVLRVSNGGTVNSEFEIIPLDQISSITTEKFVLGKDNYDDYKETYVVIGVSCDGDYYVYDRLCSETGKCEIIRITHEGSTPINYWDSIASFLYEMFVERESE